MNLVKRSTNLIIIEPKDPELDDITIVLPPAKTISVLAAAYENYHVKVMVQKSKVENAEFSNLITNIIAVKTGDDLIVTTSDASKIIFRGFYTLCHEGACTVTLGGGEYGGVTTTPNSPIGEILADGSFMVYIYANNDVLTDMLTEVDGETLGLSDLPEGMVSYIPTADEDTNDEGGYWWWLAGGIALAAVGIKPGSSDTQALTVKDTDLADTTPPTITINAIADDNIINSNEVTTTITGMVEAGSSVKLSLGGNVRTATVIATTWSYTLTPDDITAMGQGAETIIATATDTAGNTQQVTREITVDTNPPTITINAIADDNIINSNEVTTTITGMVEAGSTVKLSLGGNVRTATVSDTTWSYTLTPDDITAMGQGAETIIATATDTAGNTQQVTREITVDTAPPMIAIDAIADDNIINSNEASGTPITGTVEAGSSVKLSLGGNVHTATVISTTWSYTLTPDDITAMGQGDETIIATATDTAGNTQQVTREITVDTVPPTITINAIADDNIINSNEVTTTITGMVEAGSSVKLSLGINVRTATVSGTTWSYALTLTDLTNMGQGDETIIATATDTAGNTQQVTREITVDTAPPMIAIDAITDDNIINSNEVTTTITGTVEAGSTVKLSLGGNVRTATVSGTTWSYALTLTDLTNMGQGDETIIATATDTAGNTQQATREITVDTNPPTITINAIADDNIINSNEVTTTITGMVEAGSSVKLSLGGNVRTATVSGTTWSYTLTPDDITAMGQGAETIIATATDTAGNTQQVTREITVDTNPPTITINAIADDNIINSNEVTTTITGMVEAGSSVKLSLGGNVRTATVSDTTWSYTLTSTDLNNMGQGAETIIATATDTAGNTQQATREITVDTNPPTITINAIADDNIINSNEVTTTITGMVEAGSSVKLSLGGNVRTATVSGTTWSYTLTPDDITAMGQGAETIIATATDTAGNSHTASQDIIIDTSLPTITIDSITADKIINLSEASTTITGTVDAGSTVTLTLGDNIRPTILSASGSRWSYTLTATDLNNMDQGAETIIATATDTAGNSHTASQDIIIDTSLPTITIDAINTDNIITLNETLTGIVDAGSTVILTLGDNIRPTILSTSGTRWSYTVIAADITAMGEGAETITATATDIAGNTQGVSRAFTVDTVPPTITIDAITADNIINANEASTTITGTVDTGSTVTLTLGDVDRSASVSGTRWSYTLTPTDLNNMGQGVEVITATATDDSGHEHTISREITVDTSPPTITIDSITTDKIINLNEASTTITGTVDTDSTVILTLGNVDRPTILSASGSRWSYTLTPTDLNNMGQGAETITATATDTAGNSHTASQDIIIDTSLPTITIDNITADKIINLSEASTTITGTVDAGSTVTLTLGDNIRPTILSASGSRWSYTLTATDLNNMDQGAETIIATATDTAGNSHTASQDIIIDTSLPTITIDAINTDNIITLNETLTGIVDAGSTVILTLGDNIRPTILSTSGTRWSYTVIAADITAMGEGAETITATATDIAGNTQGVSRAFTVDTVPPTITIDAITADNIINANEASTTITGTVDTGSTVTLTLGDVDRSASVSGTRWSYTLTPTDLNNMGQGVEVITATATDDSGHEHTISREITVDTSPPTITIDSITTDKIINLNEASTTITGTVDTDSTVILTLGNVDRPTILSASGSRWSYTLTATDLNNMGQGAETITATATDTAGNSHTASQDIIIDTSLPTITIDSITADKIINLSEASTTITGTVDAGSTVTLTLGDNIRPTILSASGSRWSYTLTATDLNNMDQGAETITATATDTAGNSHTASQDIIIDTSLPTITIDAINTDNIITLNETLTGIVDAGSTVILTLGDNIRPTILSTSGTRWSYTVIAADITAMGEGAETITATATDIAGNTQGVSRAFTVDTVPPTITIDAITADNIINANEASTTITGTVDTGSTVTLTLGDVDRSASVSGTRWSYTLTPTDLNNMGQGVEVITATATDDSGHEHTISREITVDTSPPTITIDSITTDKIINLNEASTTITGTVDTDSTVILTLGNVDRPTILSASGSRWSYTLTATDLNNMGQGAETITATATDTAGNSHTASQDIIIDTSLPTITIDSITADKIINLSEASTTITGTVDAGSTVTLTLGDNIRPTILSASGSRWSYTLTATDLNNMDQGAETIIATATDTAGNSHTASQDIIIDTSLPTITIDAINTDNIITLNETLTGIVDAGSTVILTLGDNIRPTILSTSGTRWSYTVIAADITAMGEGAETITATATDIAGNTQGVSRAFTVDTVPPTITIDAITADNIINANEASTTITGTVDTGSTVTLTLGDVDRSASVSGTRWSYTLTPTDLNNMGQGVEVITATATDDSGHEHTISREITVDTSPPTITIDSITTDKIINLNEASTTITGTVDTDSTVILTLGNVDRPTILSASGSRWSYTLTPTDLNNMGQGAETITATATDTAGNSHTASQDIIIDTSLPTITIDSINTDNIITLNETLTGIVDAGSTVILTLGDNIRPTILSTSGTRWSYTVIAADITAMGEGAETITATATDIAGNTQGVSRAFTVDTVPPTITIDAITADNIINANEASTTITGTVDTGSTVTLTLGDVDRSASVSGTRWSYTLTPTDLNNMGQGVEVITATATDDSGHEHTISREITVDTSPPTITIDSITTDKIINLDEASTTITGTVDTDSTVILTLGNVDRPTILSASGSRWSYILTPTDLNNMGQGAETITATATDTAGNSHTASQDIIIDTSLPTITIDSITADKIINLSEASTTITGTVDAGSTVTLTLGDNIRPTILSASGSRWSYTLTATDLNNMDQGAETIIATATDTAGNSHTASQDIIIDTSLPTITIDAINTDNIITLNETLTGIVDAGSTVILTLGDNIRPTILSTSGTRWSYTVIAADITAMGEGAETITATATDIAGNTQGVSRAFTVDTVPPTITIDAITADNIINANEASTTITGTVDTGSTVTLTLGDVDRSASVSGTRWSYTLTPTDLNNMGQGVEVITATATDDSGHEHTISREITVDTSPPTITIDSITTDKIINLNEASTTITGTVDTDSTVILTLGNVDRPTILSASGSRWSYTLTPTDLNNMGQGAETITATATDTAGNSHTASQDIIIDTSLPTITIDSITADKIINLSEASTTITGTVDAGSTVTLTLGDNIRPTILSASGSRWSYTLTATDLNNMDQGAETIIATATDTAGNSHTASQDIIIDTSLPTITIDAINTDNIITLNETLTGIVDAGSTVILTLGDNIRPTILSTSGTRWSYTVIAADITAMGEGAETITATATDIAGNTQGVSRAFTVDTVPPTITIDAITADNIINANEASTTITGTVDTGSTVTLTLGDVDRSASVSGTRWSYTLTPTDLNNMGQGAEIITATATDDSGHEHTISREITVDTSPPTITIDSITTDKIINLNEASTTITGTVDTDSTVILTLGNVDRPTILSASGSRWSYTLTPTDLNNMGQGAETITATATDTAGNSHTASQDIIIDTSLPTITIDSITADKIINLSEASTTITGTVDAGSTVTLTLGDNIRPTILSASGSRWSYTLTPTDLNNMDQGAETIIATATDTAGNSHTASQDIIIDTVLPTITIDAINTDNIITLNETLTGIVDAGSTVILTLGDNIRPTILSTSGTRWSYTVIAADITAMGEGAETITATATDIAGNTQGVSRAFTVDTVPPTITIDAITADNIINANEASTTITGTVDTGSTVTLTLGDVDRSASVSGTRWSYTLTPTDLNNMGQGAEIITATATDDSGHEHTISREITVDTSPPTITIDSITTDKIINLNEASTTITGTVDTDSTVILTLGNVDRPTILSASGSRWSYTLTPTDLNNMGQGAETITATATDTAGNSHTASQDIIIDTSLPTITIDNITADKIINLSEASTTITGTVDAGSTVTLTLGDNIRPTILSASGSRWSYTLTATDLNNMDQGAETIIATATDTAGNSHTASQDIIIDTSLPTITIDAINTDNIITLNETLTGIVDAGSTVILTLGDNIRPTILSTSGTRWSYTVIAADITAMGEGAETITATATDIAGNTQGVSRAFTVDTVPPTITIDAITADNIINANEASTTITGTVDTGSTVTLTLGDVDRSASVSGTRWSYTLTPTDLNNMGQGVEVITATATDDSGHEHTISREITVDTSPPTITIDSITTDKIINLNEASTTITGTVDTDSTVILTLGNVDRPTILSASGSRWSYTLTATDLNNMGQGAETITATATDTAGNSHTASQDIIIDTSLPTITIDSITADKIINLSEASTTITGTVDAGSTVTLTLGDNIRPTILSASGSRWSYTLTATDLNNMDQGAETITATATDTAGNSHTASQDIIIDTSLPTITIDAINTDNIITLNETLTGIVDAGSTVILTLGDNIRPTILSTSGTRWSYTVIAADITAMGEGAETITATATDIAGNTQGVSRAFTVDTVPPTITIDAITADNIINANEASTTITGTVDTGSTVTLTLGDVDRSASVSGTRWSYTLTPTDLNNMGQGVEVITATATDDSGHEHTISREITVDTSPPTITIDSITTDKIINLNEASTTITGTVDTDSTVILTLGNVDRPTILSASGSRWSYTLTPTDLNNMGQGAETITATATDTAGNSHTASQDIIIDTSLPTITIDSITADKIINLSEASTTITGTVDAGSTVTLTLGDNIRPTILSASGSRWSYTLTATDLNNMDQGAETITATATDTAGNSHTASQDIIIDTSLPTITIDAINTDNIITLNETLTGIVDAGSTVILTLGDNIRPTILSTSGTRWSYTVIAADITAMGEGAETITATATDIAGNTQGVSRAFTVDTVPPTITIDAITADNIINANEASTTITGTVDTGSTVTLTLGDVDRSASVSGTRWSYTLTPTDLNNMGQGVEVITATATDDSGHEHTISREITVDTSPPTITIDSITTDKIINLNEASTTITGTVDTDSTVILTLGNVDRPTILSASGSRWSYTLTPTDLNNMGQGAETITATATDTAGNSHTASQDIIIDTSLPTITIDSITADKIINLSEASTTITGTVDAGSTVTLTLGDNIRPTILSASGSRWSYTLTATDLNNMDQGAETIIATATDTAGNSHTASQDIIIDTSLPTITIDAINTDNIITLNETLTGIVDAGSTVILTLGDNIRPTILSTSGTRWSYTVIAADITAMGEGAETITATATDIAGNTQGVSRAFTVDTVPPTITIDAITADNIINANEASTTITGTVDTGSTVTLTLGDVDRSASVSGTRWSYTLTPTDLNNMGQGVEVITATATDDSGHEHTISREITVDTSPPTITIDSITTDKIINLNEASTTITGTVDTDSTVILTLGNVDRPTILSASGSRWSYTLTPTDLNNMGQGAETITATATDTAGNSHTASQDIIIDTSLPTITIDSITADKIINLSEASTTITGTVDAGSTVTLTLGDNIRPTILSASGSRWSYTLTATDLNNMDQGAETIIATATDTAGNSHTASQDIIIDTVLPTITIDAINTDNIITLNETLTGIVDAGSTVILTLGDNIRPTILSTSGTRWSYTVIAADITAMGEGAETITATATDIAGNTQGVSRAFTVDTVPPTITIDAITADNIINANEASTTITGTVDTGSTVTLTLGDVDRSASVSGTRWSYTLTPTDLNNMGQGVEVITATATDDSGHEHTISREITVDTSPPTITIDSITTDKIINLNEASTTITGTVDTDSTVILTLGNVDRPTILSASGSRWSYTLTATDLNNMGQGAETITATATDTAGNSHTASQDIIIDTSLPTITIDSINTDNIITLNETLTGIVDAGSTVILTLGDNIRPTILSTSGTRWSYTVIAADITAMGEGAETITATATDIAGNTQGVSRAFTVDTVPPTITIDAITADNIINANEASTTITGTVDTGSTVTLTLGDVDRSASVSGTRWSYTLTPTDLNNMGQGVEVITATATDDSGHEHTISREITVDTSPPTITIDSITTDKIINLDEASTTITGTVDTDSTVILTLGNVDRPTILSASGSRWSYTLTATDLNNMGQGAETITATATDTAGNSHTASQDIIIDTSLPTITIDSITADKIINLSEASTTITGTVDAGSTVTLTLGDNIRPTILSASGSRWSYTLTATDLNNMDQGAETIIATATDTAGNSHTASQDIIIDTSLPTITIDAINTDNIITLNETLTGIVDAGSTVILTLGDNIRPTILSTSGTRWSYTVIAADITAMGEGAETITATATDIAGNTQGVSRAFTVDTVPPTITIDAITADNIINANEASTTITGTVDTGSTVTLTLGDVDRSASVSGTRWSYTLTPTDLNNMGQGVEVITATATDDSGHEHTISREITVDTSPPTITIDSITTDKIINLNEASTTITGTVDTDSTVILTLGNVDRPTILSASGSRWSYTLTATDLNNMGQGAETITATATDTAGNSHTASQDIIIDTSLPTITIDSITADKIINLSEASTTITGTVDAGSTVTLTLGDNIRPTILSASGSRWSYTLTATDLNNMDQGAETITATATDTAGNSHTASQDIIIDTSLPTITIDAINTDNIITLNETLTGIVDAGSTVILTLGDNIRPTILSTSGTRWSYTVIAADITAMGEGAETITATATDIAGNTQGVSRAFTVDTVPPTITIDAITADNIINANEASTTITGTVDTGSTVTLTLGDVDRSASVSGTRWSYTLTPTDLNNMGQGVEVITATATDDSGHEHTISREITVDTSPPTITIDSITTDKIINLNEASTTITGTVDTDSTVILTLGNVDRPTILSASGSRWSYTLTATDLNNMGQGAETITATATDTAGNSHTASQDIIIDTSLPTITIDSITADKIINLSEASTTITGTVDAGSTVTLTLGDNIRPTILSASGSRWSYTLTATDLNNMGQGAEIITATATDTAGNSHTASQDIIIDTSLPTITIDAINTDNIITLNETLTGIVDAGSTVILTLGDNIRPTILSTSGTRWSYTVIAADITAMGEGAETITATATDIAGNTQGVSRAFTVDTVPPTITIDAITADNIINANEASTTITGTVDTGSTVTLTLGDVDRSASVSGTRWSYTLTPTDLNNMGQGAEIITATATDDSGHEHTISREITVDTSPPTITIDSITTDKIINLNEASTTITGTVDTDSTVILTLGNNGFVPPYCQRQAAAGLTPSPQQILTIWIKALKPSPPPQPIPQVIATPRAKILSSIPACQR